MSREDKVIERILEYIETHDGCTKTMVKNAIKDMAEATIDKILKIKLIDEGKVVYDIDEVNHRSHHLHINNAIRSQMKMKKLLVSKAEEQINSQIFASAELVGGEWAIWPVNHSITVNLMSLAMQRIRESTKTKRRAGY